MLNHRLPYKKTNLLQAILGVLMHFYLQLPTPQPWHPLNVPAILETFERMIHLDTSLCPDMSLWLNLTSWPDLTLLPNLFICLDVGKLGDYEGSHKLDYVHSFCTIHISFHQFLQQEDQMLFWQPAMSSPTPMHPFLLMLAGGSFLGTMKRAMNWVVCVLFCIICILSH
jgi:hypothetical protein